MKQTHFKNLGICVPNNNLASWSWIASDELFKNKCFFILSEHTWIGSMLTDLRNPIMTWEIGDIQSLVKINGITGSDTV